jgi:hypothetical protein
MRGAELFAPESLGHRRGRGRLDEIADHGDEASRVLAVREVAAAGKDLQAAAGNRGVGRAAVMMRDEGIAVAPDDHGRHVRGEIEAVAGVDGLTIEIDDGAERAEERPTIGCVDERGVAPPDLLAGRREAHAPASEHAAKARRRVPEGVGADEREERLGEGRGQRAQHGVDLGAETAAADENDPLAALRELIGELQDDPAAEGLADEGGALVAERIQQVAQQARVRAEGVVAARFGGLAMAEQIGCDDRVVLGERGHRVPPRQGASRHAVHEDDHRTPTRGAVRDAVPVEGEMGRGGLREHRYPS